MSDTVEPCAAGVALGLARTVLARFPDWAGDVYALLVAGIVLNQAVGPPLFRAALLAVGETHKQAQLAPASPLVSAADGKHAAGAGTVDEDSV